MQFLRHKIFTGGALLALTVSVGSIGYFALGSIAHSWNYWKISDCLYMTVITLTTVGFGEVIDLHNVPGSRTFTVFILLCGLGISAYFVSTLTAFLVEGELKNVFWRNKMNKHLKNINGHIILCGVGKVGRDILFEFIKTGQDFVVIEKDEQLVLKHQESVGSFPAVIGDATLVDSLEKAKVNQAIGVISTMADDKDNLCIVVTCRELNPDLRIVTRCNSTEFSSKLELLGAEVVLPNYIGALRMVSQMVRPRVVRYLDTMLRQTSGIVRIEELRVSGGSILVGMKIGSINFSGFGNLLLLAVISTSGSESIFNPDPDYEIKEGDTLVFQAELKAYEKLCEKFA